MKIRPISFPVTPVTKYQVPLRNMPEKRRRLTNGDGRLKNTANVLSDTVKNWEILENLSDHQLLNNNSGTCSWFSSTSNPRVNADPLPVVHYFRNVVAHGDAREGK